ncbi:MAG: ABC transporter ATP-binding protein [Chloroflexi bacterium]|nr:ABC transporter ATP-binding protein [Chloroflexota bacterium]OJV92644.1 MAG: ABC transporter ATP-binding protein [Chloroflexi bacterium 54-19]
MLEVNNINTFYGKSHIIQGLSLSVEEGEAVALLGRNGVGKTTTIRSIIGFTPPRSGDILFKGKQIARRKPESISRMGMGLVPQGRRVFPNLTVKENLTVASRGSAKGGWDLERVYKYFPRLKEREKNLGSQLSGGEQMMLAIGRGLMINPELLLLDEPSDGLAPMVLHDIADIVVQLQKQGLSILLVEQNVKMALKIASRAYVLNKGQVAWAGAAEELRNNEELQHQLLVVSA